MRILVWEKQNAKFGEKYTRTTQIDSLMIVCVSTTMNCFNILHALNQISYIHGHFIDLRRVKLLDVSQRLRVSQRLHVSQRLTLLESARLTRRGCNPASF